MTFATVEVFAVEVRTSESGFGGTLNKKTTPTVCAKHNATTTTAGADSCARLQFYRI